MAILLLKYHIGKSRGDILIHNLKFTRFHSQVITSVSYESQSLNGAPTTTEPAGDSFYRRTSAQAGKQFVKSESSYRISSS